MADIYHGRTVIGIASVVSYPDTAPKDPLVARNLVIDAGRIFLHTVRSRRRAPEIRRRRVGLQKVGKEKDGCAGKSIPRNHVAGERLAGERVANGTAGRAEIPVSLGG